MRRNTRKRVPMNEPTITRAKGGTDERKVALAAVEIPDLWYADDGTGRIIETWHLAHDLKRELFEVFAQRDELLVALRDLHGEVEPLRYSFKQSLHNAMARAKAAIIARATEEGK